MQFPKKLNWNKQSAREQDPHYVWWIHGFECCVPGCAKKWPVHAHHAVRKSQMGADRTVVPLCFDHHVGGQGIHLVGVITWQKRFNVNFEELVLKYNYMYDLKENGPKHDRLEPFKDTEKYSGS